MALQLTENSRLQVLASEFQMLPTALHNHLVKSHYQTTYMAKIMKAMQYNTHFDFPATEKEK